MLFCLVLICPISLFFLMYFLLRAMHYNSVLMWSLHVHAITYSTLVSRVEGWDPINLFVSVPTIFLCMSPPYFCACPHHISVHVSTIFLCMSQTWGQLLSNVIDYITITLQFSWLHYIIITPQPTTFCFSVLQLSMVLFWLSCLYPLVFFLPMIFKLFGFLIF